MFDFPSPRAASISLGLLLMFCVTGCGGIITPSKQLPVIVTQPESISVSSGDSSTFAVTTTGAVETTQWQMTVEESGAWVDVAGATDFSYVIPVTTPALQGSRYRVIVSGAAGSVTSAPAKLTVLPPPPLILQQPTNQAAFVGRSATFMVTTSGTPLTYQWQLSVDMGVDWVSIPGATANAFVTEPTDPSMNGYEYRVIVRNAAGVTTSLGALLFVSKPTFIPVIVAQPLDQLVAAGGSAFFSVTVQGTSLSYQWQSSADGLIWMNVNTATDPALTVNPVSAFDNGREFRVVTSNGSAQVISRAAILTVIAPAASSRFARIVTGTAHTCVLAIDHTVACWGQNDSGQLGDGTTDDRALPATVIGLSNVVDLDAGRHHTCAVVADGTVRCWGNVQDTEPDEGPVAVVEQDALLPWTVPGIENVIAISVGDEYTCVAHADRSAACWSVHNTHPDLADRPTQIQSAPVASVAQMQTVLAKVKDNVVQSLAVHETFRCELEPSTSVFCWGTNLTGQLGEGTTDENTVPTAVPRLGGIVALSTGFSANHSCVVTSLGTVLCWGADDYGQSGNGHADFRGIRIPTAVRGIIALH